DPGGRRELIELQHHIRHLDLLGHRLREAEDVRRAHGRQGLDERGRLVAVDPLLHGDCLLFQAGGLGTLRRDENEVAEDGAEEERTQDERYLLAVRQAREAGGHEAPLPLRTLATMMKSVTGSLWSGRLVGS